MAGRREMENLGNHAGDTVVPAFDSQCSGLDDISCWSQKIRLGVIMSYKIRSRTGTAKDDPFGVHAQQTCVLFTLKFG